MTALTRRRDPQAREESWQVFYGDVRAGRISKRTGNPFGTDSWEWSCGFYPGKQTNGTAATFDRARADFLRAWPPFLAARTPADFDTHRRDRAFTAWKYAMWEANCRLPSQTASGRSHCFCGAEIEQRTVSSHIYSAHMAVPAR
jgi:hypothetical protein